MSVNLKAVVSIPLLNQICNLSIHRVKIYISIFATFEKR
jgi:hypothetical protein